MALIIITTLGILTAAMASLVASNDHAFGRDRQETLAFNSAEAGINYGVAEIVRTYDSTGAAAPNATIGSAGSPVVAPAKTGNAGWWAVKTAVVPATNPVTYKWVIYAKATSPNGNVVRMVSADLPSAYHPGTPVPTSTAWHYGLFVANPTTCFGPQGNADITISVYVNGNICVGSTGNISEPTGSSGGTIHVYATGTVQLSSGGKVGAASKKIADITSTGCKDKNGTPCNNQNATNVYAIQYNGVAPKLTKPPVPAGIYTSADWSHPTCISTSGYTTFTFDSNSSADLSLGTVGNSQLFPSSKYDCTVYDASHTNIVGRLAWDPATQVWTAQGLIYIDGSVQISSNTQISYQTPMLNSTWGKTAGMYIAGSVTTNGGSSLCGPGSTGGSGTCTPIKWNPTLGVLFITVLNQANAGVGWQMNGNAVYQVALYIDKGSYSNSGNAYVVGPVIADSAVIKGTSTSTDVPDVPSLIPGGTTVSPATITWSRLGSWRQCSTTSCG